MFVVEDNDAKQARKTLVILCFIMIIIELLIPGTEGSCFTILGVSIPVSSYKFFSLFISVIISYYTVSFLIRTDYDLQLHGLTKKRELNRIKTEFDNEKFLSQEESFKKVYSYIKSLTNGEIIAMFGIGSAPYKIEDPTIFWNLIGPSSDKLYDFLNKLKNIDNWKDMEYPFVDQINREPEASDIGYEEAIENTEKLFLKASLKKSEKRFVRAVKRKKILDYYFPILIAIGTISLLIFSFFSQEH